jgi:predicted dehydrogenase
MTLKVVIIGKGFGEHTAAPAFRDAGCEVQVVSPRDDEAVRAAIEAPCDLVSIHSPPFMHLPHVRLATQNRRHVLCDKPFGRNAAEAREMVDLAARAGVLNFLNFEFRQDPLRQRLKAFVDEGAIGAPVHVSWAMYTSMGRDRPQGWLFEKETGGGWIGAFGSHVIDALRWLLGEVDEASAHRRTEIARRRDRDRSSGKLHPCTAEDAFTARFRMKSGVTVAFDSAFAASVNVPERIVVFGEAGALVVNGGKELLLLRPGRADERYTFRDGESDPHKPGITNWVATICQAVAEGRQLAPDFRDGLAAAEVMDRLRA